MYIQQIWQVQLVIQLAIYSYIDKFYFYLYANCSLITYQLYKNTKALWKGPENDIKLTQNF